MAVFWLIIEFKVLNPELQSIFQKIQISDENSQKPIK